MARHSKRVQRLVVQVRDLRKARRARRSPEELVAEIARMVERAGGPADPFPKNVDAAMAAAVIWLDQQIRTGLAALPVAVREEFLARNPRFRSRVP